MRFWILVLLAFVSFSGSARATSLAEVTCDKLAAWGGDNTRPAGIAGVEFEKIDAARAIPVCRQAVKEHPSPRLYYQLARALEAQNNATESIEWYKKAGAGGHTKAMVQLGFAYTHYLNDPQQGFTWYKKASDAGDSLGQQGLGVLYRDGIGVAQNDTEAMRLFKLAADQGDDEGESSLAWMYYNGRGAPVDYKKAAALYQKAAARNNVNAIYSLALMYRDGTGVAKDYWKAINYLTRGKEAGDTEAENELFRLEEEHLDALVQSSGGSEAVCGKLCDKDNDQCYSNADAIFCITALDYCLDKCEGR